ncbi:MAG: response regulator transcription factor [Chloroflexi bacterium]|nr:response regulator transcription factor [Chloroflexota bacterium]
MRVFIADESPAVRSRLVKLLNEQRGIEVIGQAGEANEAMQAIRKLKPDVLVLAVHMYMGSGLSILRAVRTELPSTVIIMLTNCAYPQYRAECLRSGANYFFDKSNEFDQFSVLMKQLAQSRHTTPHGMLAQRALNEKPSHTNPEYRHR